MFNDPKKLDKTQKSLAILLGVIALISFLDNLPVMVKVGIVTYILFFILYFSLPWESWKANDAGAEAASLKKWCGVWHLGFHLFLLVVPMLWAGISFGLQKLPITVDQAFSSGLTERVTSSDTNGLLTLYPVDAKALQGTFVGIMVTGEAHCLSTEKLLGEIFSPADSKISNGVMAMLFMTILCGFFAFPMEKILYTRLRSGRSTANDNNGLN